MASLPGTSSYFEDEDNDTPYFAAREYPGCFTAAQVRGRLIGEESLGSHFLAGCACSKLHDQCHNNSFRPEEAQREAFETRITVTLDTLSSAAAQGCWFCSMIHGGVIAAPSWDQGRMIPTPRLSNIIISADSAQKWDCSVRLFSSQDPPTRFYIRQDRNKSSSCNSHGTASHVSCKLFKVRPDLPSTSDLQSLLSFAHRSSERCRQNHRTCGRSLSNPSSSSPTMPTRLLDIQIKNGRYSVSLVERTDADFPHAGIPYVTLSHCWGKTMKDTAKTTRSTLGERKKPGGIAWSGLTQTFRDAIALAERLGYRYLWIDSLCIIQDDYADWEAESGRMAQVYENGDLMLSAHAAADGTQGLFRSARISTQPWMTSTPTTTAATTTTTDNDSGRDVLACYDKTHRLFGQMIQMFTSSAEWAHVCPLDTRAWCFQERRLAPRILHFGIDDLHWECREEAYCECGVFGPGEESFRGAGEMRRQLLLAPFCTVEDKITYWYNTVAQYSERFLTNWGDRLPAISGLAKTFLVEPSSSGPSGGGGISGHSQPQSQIQQSRGFYQVSLGDYLAGLWSWDLKRGLCWYADYQPGSRLSTREQYVAPSWSWASVAGPVNWPRGEFEPQIEVLSARCKPSSADPTGAVSDGDVVLRGRIVNLSAYHGKALMPNGTQLIYYHLEYRDAFTGAKDSLGTYRPDAVADPPGHMYHAGAPYFTDVPQVRSEDLLPLDLKGQEYHGMLISNLFVMVLARHPQDEHDTFERVGSIFMENLDGSQLDKSRFFQGAEPRTIRII